jgi:hypothetical protein
MGTIRAWMGLALGMLSLGRLYYEDLPIISDWGFFGAVFLGGILILVFMGVGWAYDEKAKMWRAKLQVNIERNPYRCVPNYKAFALEYPILFAALTSFYRIFDKLNLPTKMLDDISEYLKKNYSFRPEKEDIEAAQDLGEEFMKNHPFRRDGDPGPRPVGLRARAMLGFETQNRRLIWIQELTGMAQDAFVITGVYIIWIFPDVVTDGAVPFAYLLLGLFIIALPIMFMITAVGWLYDRKLRVWSVDTAVKIERNPYSYLAEPSLYTLFMPYYYTFFKILREIHLKEGMDTQHIDKVMEFLDEYFTYDVSEVGDMQRARQLRRDFGRVFPQEQNEVSIE